MVAVSGRFVALLVVPLVVWPTSDTRLGEQLDAFGSPTPPSAVEPADWNVLLTRFVGTFVFLLGFGRAFAG